ncbi:hypothetical protein XA68_16119 [Ophiocordyceps unilateralis]|uniref:Peptidase A1 domain-containing protein n=1 Tax=Ophiocordyceps unilateralis TaxID=268505 RepID=A0A2A9P681_OPHUN|nr:hypothetical protein XA68_16119 [Ophiocordyceps unilateralis]
MHSSLHLVLTLVFASLLALAVPTTSGIQKRSFIVKRVPAPALRPRDGVEEMARAFNKYNLPLPRDLSNAIEKRQLKKRELDMAAEASKADKRGDDQSTHQRRDGMGGDQDVRLGLAAAMGERRSLQTRGRSELGNGQSDFQRRDGMGGDQHIRLGLAATMGQRRSIQARQDQEPAAAAEKQPEGEQPEGEQPEGEQPEGEQPEGEQPQGEQPQGEQPQGEQPQGEQPAGEQAAGEQPQGGQPQQQGKDVGSVQAKPENNDAEYLSPVKIGGQELTLDFDTGSSDLWVFNTQLAQQPQQQQPQQQSQQQPQLSRALQNHVLYNPQDSKTFEEAPGLQFKISYGDGSGALGTVGMDEVDVGGVKTMQAVQLPTQVTGSFLKDANNNGLMGLAFSKINTVKPEKQKTFFESAMPLLKEPVFTADLRRNSSGAYEFGSIDQSKFQGEMKWTAVNNTQGFWQFPSTQFAVGDGQPQQTTAGAQAIADTGTTLILADSKIAQAYYSQVPGAQMSQAVGGYTIPCDAKLPDLMLAIGDNMARVAGDQINFSPIQAGSTECFGGIQAVPGGTMGIYGDIFFKSNFVAFHGGNDTQGPMLGVAQHA